MGFLEQVVKYYENGNKLLECTYQDDKLHGSYKEWHSNGNIRIIGNFNKI